MPTDDDFNWQDGLEENDLKVVGRFSDSDDRVYMQKLAKGYAELHKKFSSSPKIPADDAEPEVWNRFYEKLGRPETADDYKMSKDSLPEGFPWDEDFEKQMKKVAHDAGINTKQFESLAGEFLKYNGSAFLAANEATNTAKEAAAKELKEEWKDDYEKNVNIAKHAVAECDDDNETIKKYLDSTGLGDDPVFIRLFRNIGLKILDDTLVHGTPSKKSEKPKGQYEKEFYERYGTGDNS